MEKKKLNIFPKISQPRLGFRTYINCPSASLFVSHLARAERGERRWGSGDLSAGSHCCCLCPGREYQQLFRKEHAKFLQKAAPEGKPGRPSPRRHFGSFSEVTEGLRAEAAQVESPVLWPWSVLCRAAHMELWGSLYWQNTQNQSLVSCLVVLGFCLFFSAHQSNSGINILIRLHHRITQIVSLHFFAHPIGQERDPVMLDGRLSHYCWWEKGFPDSQRTHISSPCEWDSMTECYSLERSSQQNPDFTFPLEVLGKSSCIGDELEDWKWAKSGWSGCLPVLICTQRVLLQLHHTQLLPYKLKQQHGTVLQRLG